MQPSLRHSAKCFCWTASTSLLGSRRLKACVTATRRPAGDWLDWARDWLNWEEASCGASTDEDPSGDCAHAPSTRADAAINNHLLSILAVIPTLLLHAPSRSA